MGNLYSDQHRALQAEFDSIELADRVHDIIVLPEIPEEHQLFIESRDFFFLTTIDHRGFPTCSYKGGTAGFIKVLDPQTLAFPIYNGNGMFLSTGNITTNNKVGLLFIDFETPHRVRVQGEASIDKQDPLLKEFDGAELVIRIKLSEIFFNCPRYIHKYERKETSQYAPQPDCEAPIPAWKRIDAVQDVISEADKEKAEKLGTITPEEYGAMVQQGKG